MLENKNSIRNSRRKLLQTTVWAAPVVAAVSLPQHAYASVVTTTAGSPTTTAPNATTTAPNATTTAPNATTMAPIATTMAPIATTGDVVISAILWRQTASNDPNVLIDEYVEIRNNDSLAIDISGWILRCLAENFDFTFPNHIIQPGETCRIFSHQPQGSNTWPCQFTFGRTSPGSPGNYIWNNTGDTAVLIDSTNTTVDSQGYTSSSPSPIIY